MSTNREQEVRTVVSSALARAPEERSSYLDSSCPDADFRREVDLVISDHLQTQGPSVPDAMPKRRKLDSGATLGPYRITSLMGAGGMGVVYKARDERLQRDVAVKVLPPGLLTNEPARYRFRTEALALAKLSHPNIAAVYDVGEQDGTDFIVMECVPGQSLAEKLRPGPLGVREALSLAVEVASALEEAHEQGVVHRDLKPSNIMVTPKGHAKVLDFGLAKLLASGESQDPPLSALETKGPVGTLLYMSPEQAEGHTVDSRTDLWSLGVILFESLSGTPPFKGSSGYSLFRAITQDAPAPLRQLRPDIPAPVADIVSHALEKDASKRYRSASEVFRDSSEALIRISSSAQPPESSGVRLPARYIAAFLTALVLVAAAVGWFVWHSEKRQWVLEKAVPEISSLQASDRSLAAFLLLRKAQRYSPSDPRLQQLFDANTRAISVNSSPPGATVEIQDYFSPERDWYRLGTTPLNAVRVPSGYLRWRISKPGLPEYVVAPGTSDQMNFSLDAASQAPAGMVWVPGGNYQALIDFIGWQGPYRLPGFYMDQFEVTNAQYQQFVDSGGYDKRQYWNEKFIKDGRELTWDEAIASFRDSTGRAGPLTWAGGHFPEGMASYPVSGVSWYEASAYAAFRNKSLPVLSQWFRAAPGEVAGYIAEASNISRSGLAPVGAFTGLGPFGTYDMAGNVREWAVNSLDGDLHFILGGAWNSQTYQYQIPEAFPPFDRSAGNGIRCVRNIQPVPTGAGGLVKTIARDFTKARPVSDETFRVYQAMYADPKQPLHAKVEGVTQDTADWRIEKVSFDAAYNHERVPAYLFLPKRVRPPYQTIIFFPSARVYGLPNSKNLGDIEFFDYAIQSGRAVMYPIYQDTYERTISNTLPGTSESTERAVQRFRDLARSIDYLETRPDIDKNKFAYMGVSMGSAEGVIYGTLEDRLKTVILLDGGFFLGETAPGRDQVDFAPRLKKPVLMVNGRYDFSFSLNNSQTPLFNMLGTPAADKEHVVLDSPHDVTARRPELIKAVLAWLDKYLGHVE